MDSSDYGRLKDAAKLLREEADRLRNEGRRAEPGPGNDGVDYGVAGEAASSAETAIFNFVNIMDAYMDDPEAASALRPWTDDVEERLIDAVKPVLDAEKATGRKLGEPEERYEKVRDGEPEAGEVAP